MSSDLQQAHRVETDRIQSAAAALVKWWQRELELVIQKNDLLTQIGRLQASLGAALAENRNAADPRPLVETRGELELLDAAILACRSSRLEAVRAKFRAMDESLEAQAHSKKKELSDLEASLGKHLKGLSDLQGVAYGMNLFGPHMPASIIGTPRSRQLESEISRLGRQLKDAREREIPRSGAADVRDAATPEALLEQLAIFDGELPAAAEVLCWIENCELAIRKRTPHRCTLPRHIYLAWRSGSVNEEESFVFVPELVAIARENPQNPSGDSFARIQVSMRAAAV